MSRLPRVDKKPKNNKSTKFRWVDSQWEKLLTKQEEDKALILKLEMENAEFRDKLISLGENPNQLSFDFEVKKDKEGNGFEVERPMIYESPDGGKTVYGRRADDERKLVTNPNQMELFED